MKMRHLPPLLLAALSFAAPQLQARELGGELMLFSYLPSREIDWSSPRNTLKTTINSQVQIVLKTPEIYRSGIGHIHVRYKCRGTDGRERDVWSGMTGQNEKTLLRQDLFKEQIGLGVLFKSYRDGQIQMPLDKADDNTANYQGRKERNAWGKKVHLQPLFLRVPISAAECDEIDAYHEYMLGLSWDGNSDLEAHKRQADRDILFFGFNFPDPHLLYKRKLRDPSVRIGTGCTEFGASFLKLVNRFDPIFDKTWKRQLKVSERLIGTRDTRTGETRKVSVIDILGKVGASWEHRGWPSRPLEFYDTEKIWDFLDGVRTCEEIRAGKLGARVPAKNCTADVMNWVKANHKRMRTHDKYQIYADRIDVKRRRSGKPGAWTYHTEKTHYKEWVEIEGITLK